MARPINAGFTPAQIIQQFDYYRYPIEKLVAAAAVKEQQQIKAIDALDEYDSELGKYKALPGDIKNRDGVIQSYNLIKDATANQDLTGRTGRKAIGEFKAQLTGEILPKLQKYNSSAEAYAKNYKDETDKFSKGESIKATVDFLDYVGKTWDSEKQGIYSGITRGKYLPYELYLKEYNPKLLDGSWNPADFAKAATIYGDNYAQSISKIYTKTINPADIEASHRNWKQYLREQGYYSDINWSVSRNMSEEDGLKYFDMLNRREFGKIIQSDIIKDFVKENNTTDKVKEFAAKYGTDEATIKKIFSGDNDAAESVIMNKLEALSQKSIQELSALSPDQRAQVLATAATEAYLYRNVENTLRIYGNDITDFKIDRWTWENYANKKALEFKYSSRLKSMENESSGGDYTLFTTDMSVTPADKRSYMADNVTHYYNMIEKRNQYNALLNNPNRTPAQENELELLSTEITNYDYSGGQALAAQSKLSKDQLGQFGNLLNSMFTDYKTELSNHENNSSVYVKSRRLSSDELAIIKTYMNKSFEERQKLTQADYIKVLEIGSKLRGLSYRGTTYEKLLWPAVKSDASIDQQDFAESREVINQNAKDVKNFLNNITTLQDTRTNSIVSSTTVLGKGDKQKPFKITTKGEIVVVNDDGSQVIYKFTKNDQASFNSMLEGYYNKAGRQYQPTMGEAILSQEQMRSHPVLGNVFKSVSDVVNKKTFTIPEGKTDALIDIPNIGTSDLRLRVYKIDGPEGYLYEYVDANGEPLLKKGTPGRLFTNQEGASNVLSRIFEMSQSGR